jgi:hypothetical protein
VRLAAQVLSHSVAAGISMQVATGQLPPTAKGTAEFAEKVDTVFDMLNSRMHVADKPARWAVSSGNDHVIRLLEAKDWVSTWTFKGAKSQSAIKCHWGLQTSIASIASLSTELLNEGYRFVCTARFNQDCVENFFSVIYQVWTAKQVGKTASLMMTSFC